MDLAILQFDSLDDRDQEILRGGKFLNTKITALYNLKQEKIWVYLFSILVEDVNTDLS